MSGYDVDEEALERLSSHAYLAEDTNLGICMALNYALLTLSYYSSFHEQTKHVQNARLKTQCSSSHSNVLRRLGWYAL